MTGQTFGRLTVVSYLRLDKGKTVWRCACACGTIKDVRGPSLRTGNTKSCGCLSRDTVRRRSTKHGRAKTPEYVVWLGMKQRCSNTKHIGFPQYGARGIRVCERWRDDFAAFLADMGRRPSPAHSLERINNAWDYEPGNVRWATRSEQARNKRNNVLLTLGGETLTMTDWATRLGTTAQVVWTRLNRQGWSIERALTTPVR
jgi:hypothetical protein